MTHLRLKAAQRLLSPTAGDRNAGGDAQYASTSGQLSLGWKSVQATLDSYWLGRHPGRASLPQALEGHVLRWPLTLASKPAVQAGPEVKVKRDTVLQRLLHMGLPASLSRTYSLCNSTAS